MGIKLSSTREITSDRFVCLVVGESGVGKTSLAKTIDPERTLILSAESGLLSLKGADIATYDITKGDNGESLTDSEKINRVREFVKFLGEPGTRERFKNIFVDSLTDVAEVWAKHLQSLPEFQDPKQALRLWGRYNTEVTAFIKFMRDLSHYNVIFTCLSKQEKDGVELVDQFNFPGNALKSNIKAWFDLVFVYKVYETDEGPIRKLITNVLEHPLAKDRSGKLESYEDPDLQGVMDKVLGDNNG